MKQTGIVEIEISGRIPKYFFGSVKKKYKGEIAKALKLIGGTMDDEEFLRGLLNMTLELSDPKDFSDIISKDKLSQLPNLNKLVKDILDGEASHFNLLEELLDSPSDLGSGFISFFEDDSTVSVMCKGENIIKDQTLKTFSSSISEGSFEDDAETEYGKYLEEIIDANKSLFGLSEYFTWTKNKFGSFFVEDSFSPESFQEFAEKEPQITVYFDDITTYRFIIESTDFDFKDLVFLRFGYANDFRDSANPTVFNYLFYKGNHVIPQENRHRDKGITLYTSEGENPHYRLSFLLDG
jgi:hypothetical protein